MCVRRCVSHAVSNQRLLALDDVSLDPPVVIPPLPEETEDSNHSYEPRYRSSAGDNQVTHRLNCSLDKPGFQFIPVKTA